VRKLIEATHVSLGGEVGDIEWAFPYLDDEHRRYVDELLATADALVLGRKTYDGLSAAYPAMEATAEGAFREYVHRINTIPKHVATRSPGPLDWNARPIEGDVVEAIRVLKAQPGGNLVKFGTGPLDALLLEHGLVDEYHFWLAPVAAPATVQPLFEGIDGASALALRRVRAFRSGVVALVYSPPSQEGHPCES
jgi:dihydrofolate reductase